MEHIYNVYGWDMENGYCFENANFSSKKTALDSLAYIREHWMKKILWNKIKEDECRDIDVFNLGTTDDLKKNSGSFSVLLDERFKLTITKHPIYKSVTKYI
tara:strand:+ start:330 stop:632 length:303 start_codon:yes stop_codon:yes gene_type:complete